MGFIAVDVGFGDTKVYYANGGVKFPTIIAKAQEGEGIAYEGKRYLVGEEAYQYASMPDLIVPLRSAFALIKYYPLLIHAAIRKIGLTEDKVEGLVVGLSLLHYDRYYEKLAKVMNNYTVGGTAVNFVLNENFVILPQGWGAVYDYRPDGNHKGFLVVDVGYYTTDVAYIAKGNILHKSKSKGFGIGVSTVIELVASHIENETGLKNISRARIREAVENGEEELIILGDRINIGDVYRAMVEDTAEQIAMSISAYYEDLMSSLEGVLLVGGGAYIFKDILKEVLPNVITPEEPEFANVRGYYKRLVEVFS